MQYCHIPRDSVVKMLSVTIAAGFHLILAWSIMVVEECLYTGIRDGSIEVLSTSATCLHEQ